MLKIRIFQLTQGDRFGLNRLARISTDKKVQKLQKWEIKTGKVSFS
jgi:hypothetical protein